MKNQGIATETVFLNIDRRFPCVSIHRISETAGVRVGSVQIGSLMYAAGLAGLSIEDHVAAYDTGAGIKPPETESEVIMDTAYRRGQSPAFKKNTPKPGMNHPPDEGQRATAGTIKWF